MFGGPAIEVMPNPPYDSLRNGAAPRRLSILYSMFRAPANHIACRQLGASPCNSLFSTSCPREPRYAPERRADFIIPFSAASPPTPHHSRNTSRHVGGASRRHGTFIRYSEFLRVQRPHFDPIVGAPANAPAPLYFGLTPGAHLNSILTARAIIVRHHAVNFFQHYNSPPNTHVILRLGPCSCISGSPTLQFIAQVRASRASCKIPPIPVLNAKTVFRNPRSQN
ncbi:hypothetical protein B0H17DRAFT_1185175 [Mycena rosella]|uniref:Uncharacterized protein n=1 Tax=Mycena rosella TaxID=1033263 RepID=A0AAD7CTL9_MYCRO|nr:hypothetical protein B0H17DRAFT_1185175 [Mycena rosella]